MTTIIPVGATIPDVTHHRAAVNGTELHYVSAGTEGTPILLVHGFPETWWAFRELIPHLAASHRVYAVDLRGFGDSATAEEDFSDAVGAEDLHALIERLALRPVHLLGQDVSGGTVYRLAAMHPDDVIDLTVVESGLAGFGAERLADVTQGGVWYVGALAAPGIAALLFEKNARAFIGEYLYPRYGVEISPEVIDEFARAYGRPGGFSGAVGLYRGMISGGDELRALALNAPLAVPVTAIGSAGGGSTHATLAAVTARNVKDIRLDSVGHYVAQQAPELLAETLIRVFATNEQLGT